MNTYLQGTPYKPFANWFTSRGVMHQFDADKSGNIDIGELRQAVKAYLTLSDESNPSQPPLPAPPALPASPAASPAGMPVQLDDESLLDDVKEIVSECTNNPKSHLISQRTKRLEHQLVAARKQWEEQWQLVLADHAVLVEEVLSTRWHSLLLCA